KALPFYQKFPERTGNDPKARAELADQYWRVGYITTEIGNKSEAHKAYEQAEGIYRALVKANPAVTEYQNALATTLNNMGNLLQAQGKRQGALLAYRQARDLREKLVKGHAAVTEYQNGLASTLNNLGLLLKAEGKRDEALKAHTQARD